jgi:hypothetical protein
VSSTCRDPVDNKVDNVAKSDLTRGSKGDFFSPNGRELKQLEFGQGAPGGCPDVWMCGHTH